MPKQLWGQGRKIIHRHRGSRCPGGRESVCLGLLDRRRPWASEKMLEARAACLCLGEAVVQVRIGLALQQSMHRACVGRQLYGEDNMCLALARGGGDRCHEERLLRPRRDVARARKRGPQNEDVSSQASWRRWRNVGAGSDPGASCRCHALCRLEGPQGGLEEGHAALVLEVPDSQRSVGVWQLVEEIWKAAERRYRAEKYWPCDGA